VNDINPVTPGGGRQPTGSAQGPVSRTGSSWSSRTVGGSTPVAPTSGSAPGPAPPAAPAPAGEAAAVQPRAVQPTVQQPAASAQGQSAYPPPIRPVYEGRLAALYVIYLKNLVLDLLTLGLYRFWARTRLRRYLWSHTSLFGDRLEYHGTGLEMFFGFLVGLGILLVLAGLGVGAYDLAGDDNPLAEIGLDTTISWGLVVLGAPLLYVAEYGGLRYRLSRTSWRGIRGRLTGSAWAYGARAIGLHVANAMCGYLLLPVLQTNLARYQVSNARLGSAQVEFAGRSGDIYGRYIGYYFLNIAAWIGVGVAAAFIITGFFSEVVPDPKKFFEQATQLELHTLLWIGLALVLGYVLFSVMILPVRCWYEAYLVRYLVSRTRLAGMLFVTGVGTRQMWGYLVLNYLIILCTLGMGFPWVLHRTMRLITDQLWVYGTPDARQIRGQTDDSMATGEGLLDLLAPGAV